MIPLVGSIKIAKSHFNKSLASFVFGGTAGGALGYLAADFSNGVSTTTSQVSETSKPVAITPATETVSQIVQNVRPSVVSIKAVAEIDNSAKTKVVLDVMNDDQRKKLKEFLQINQVQQKQFQDLLSEKISQLHK